MTGRLLTADELAARWQVNKGYIWRLTREGRLPASVVVQLGPRTSRYRLEAIEDFEEAGGTAGQVAA